MATESKFLELLCEMSLDGRKDLNYKIESEKVLISLENCSKTLILEEKNVDELYDGKEITNIDGIKYYPDCGFSFDAYCEFFINLTHPNYYIDDWPNSDNLVFKIDNDLIECSYSSSLAILLFNQMYYDYYDDDDDPYDYLNYLKKSYTLKISRHSNEDFQDIFNKAIYYINSHYLANTGATVTLLHLGHDNDTNEFDKLEEKLKKLSRKRIRTRKNFSTCDPLKIYNYACSLKNEDQFLTFYRVLEYFFDRYKIQTVKENRFDNKVTDTELIKIASLKGEQEHLRGLVSQISTLSVRDKLVKYALYKKLFTKDKFDELSNSLYSYRNSIVHAKESQIENTVIPNPFDKEQYNIVKGWIYIVRFLANLSINYFIKV